MKQFLEYIPLIFFLIIYKLDERLVTLGSFEFTFGGIFSATAFLMIGYILVFGYMWKSQGSLTRMQWVIFAAMLVFCGFTLFFHSETILKWKAPVANWIMAAVFLGSQFVGKQNMTKTMFGQVVTMPDQRWNRLNIAWVFVFLIVGTSNLFVAFTFPDYWVDFKVFGSMGMVLLAVIGQIFYIYPYLQEEEAQAAEEKSEKS
ncbi:MAG: inner membrane-spanning protein YciB [Pseudomonadota bacterium]